MVVTLAVISLLISQNLRVANIVVVILAVFSLIISQNLMVANFMVVILAVFSLMISTNSDGGQHSGSHISCFQFGDISKI